MGIFDKMMSSDLSSSDSEISNLDKSIRLIEEQGYNIEEMEGILRNESKYQLIESVAGSGKTTTLNFKLLVDSYSGRSWGKQVWVNTFLKSGAEALKDDFFTKIRSLGISVPMNNTNFSTIHSEFYKVLTSIGLKIDIISPNVDRDMKNSISKDLSIGAYPGYLNINEMQAFMTLETYINSHKEEPSDDVLYTLGLDDLGCSSGTLKDALRILKERRLTAEMYSFDDLQLIMYEFLIEKPNPVLINLVSNRYSYIYLDEFQDTSSIQYEILKVYFQNAEQVVFVGDSDQSIYSWRGADVDIITDRLSEELDVDIQNLTINYRVPSNILDPIARSIRNNVKRLPKDIRASRSGGEIVKEVFPKKSKMDNWTVQSLISEQMNTEFDSIAVLASTNLDITELALNLIILDTDSRVDFSIGGTMQDLNRKVYKDVWNLAKIFSDNPNESLRTNLRFLSGNSIYNHKCIQIEELLRNRNQSLLTIDADDFYHHIRDHQMRQWYKHLMDENGSYMMSGCDPIEGLLSTFDFLLYTYAGLIDVMPDKRNMFEDKASKVMLFKRLITVYKIGTPQEFLTQIGVLNDRIKSHFRVKNTKIVLTTPFDFKGKEADLVYIYNDTKSKFPRAKSPEQNYEEERRLHYIAGTRAKLKCVYLTISGSESPFLLEMGL